MADCSSNYHFHHLLSTKLLLSRVLPKRIFSFVQPRPFSLTARTNNVNVTAASASAVTSCSGSFTWDDVFQISDSQNLSSDLQGFFDKVKICNRGSENLGDFIPFVVENQVVGYVHDGFTDHLRNFPDVFVLPEYNSQDCSFGDHLRLHPLLKTLEDRTRAVGDVVKCLGDEIIPGIRNELYPVMSSFGKPVLFSLERAAAPYFGTKAYGVHMNGYVERDGQKYLWIGKRSDMKPTYPGMLDHLVAGGLPHGISCGDNLVKECEEEAGIMSSIAKQAIPVGIVSYMDIEGYRYKRDVLFCYDLKLPQSFTPKNQDGEVGSFKLIPLHIVANVIQRTEFFKPNCNLVIIDFLFRHGYIKPEDHGYLELLHGLRRVSFT